MYVTLFCHFDSVAHTDDVSQMTFCGLKIAAGPARRSAPSNRAPTTRRQDDKTKPFRRDSEKREKPKISPEAVPTTPLTEDLVGRLTNALHRTPEDADAASLSDTSEKVSKRIARCGLCSRREAEKWILDGRVKIDGQLVLEVAARITPRQQLLVDNIPVKAEPPKLFIFNKVRNMLITKDTEDEKGRDTLGQLLEEMGDPTLMPVGRLDFSSEGLLLLTNDGELKRYLEHPDSKIERKYRVRVYGRVQQSRFDGLEQGITIDGFRYRGIKVTVEDASKRAGPTPEPQWRVKASGRTPAPEARANTWLTVSLSEGKNREIRRIMEHLGLEVSRLIRIQYGPYKLRPDIESGIVAPVDIKPDLMKHTNQFWEYKAPVSEEVPSVASRLRMPKSNPRPKTSSVPTSSHVQQSPHSAKDEVPL